jgi:4-amino-4-deoxy-L-arabinose transferase-like glycosyltransferase
MSVPTASLTILRAVVALLGAAAIAAYLAVGFVHLRYPFELEWIEGGMVDAVQRLVDGRPLYVAPSLDYVPFIYAPLWFHVTAALSRVFGVGFFAARFVSFLSSIGVIALVARFVHKETGARLPALAAAGLFAATYPIAASFYDLARVDSLFLVLLLGALYVVRFHEGARGAVAAAVLFALAFFTKQSAPIVFAPVALHLVLADRRRGALFAAVGAGLMVGGALAYDAVSGGWFRHFVVTLPAGHTLVKRVLLHFWIELLLMLGIACAFAVVHLVLERRPRERRFHFFAAAGMFGASLAGRMHLGGWANVLAPAFVSLAILFGLGLHAALARVAALPEARARILSHVVLLAAAGQLAVRAYDPRPFLPAAAHAEAWRGVIAQVQAVAGDVFVPAHGFVGPRAGKPAHAHQMAISDELRAGAGDSAAQLRRAIRRALVEKRFAAIVLDNEWLPKEQLGPNYQRTGEVPDRKDLGPVIGWRTAQPQSLWEPKP